MLGILMVVIFVITGQIMDKSYDHLEGMEGGLRMFFRSRHIYILLVALINLGIGTYISLHTKRWRMILQVIGSTMIFVASVVFVAAFFLDTRVLNWETSVARSGIFLDAYGVLFHFISGLGAKGKSRESIEKS